MTPDRLAAAVRLRVVDGLSTRQIGERLGVPPRTVARWLHGLPVPAWTKRPNAKDGQAGGTPLALGIARRSCGSHRRGRGLLG